MLDELSERDYQRLATMLQGHSGIRLPPAKRIMVEGRLRKRVRALGLASLDEYCRALFERGELESEFDSLVDVVTTNKTDFFREPDHFDYLREFVVPELLNGRSPHSGRPLKLWSAACSIGAEAYTMAMVLAEMAQQRQSLRFSILGTDISTEVLRQAEKAIYPVEMMAPVPEDLQHRYIMWSRKPGRGKVRIVPELRRLVRFMQLNLMDATYPVDRDVDVIFCRNILIYFDRETQRAVVERLCSHLHPGGFLFLGHSESVAGTNQPGMRQLAATILQKQ